jgi:D-glycero-alpha-D-manno-heptose-7-phosphate kinase
VVNRTIVATAPTRIDFAGGTLDIPPLYLFHEPALTINVAITLCATVTVRETGGPGIRLVALDQGARTFWASAGQIDVRRSRFLELVARLLRSFAPRSVEVTTDCQAPAGAGTGGSSALAIAATAALARRERRRMSRSELIEYARAVETQTIRVPTGYQDYYAAVYGGASVIEFGRTGIVRRPLAGGEFLEELERHLLLVYTGKPRFSGANNWQLFQRHMGGDARVFRFFERLKANALVMREAFHRQDLRAVAEVLNEDWAIRRVMLPRMSTPLIDTLVRSCRRAGAMGARVCGAGGGGCIALLIDPASRPHLERLLTQYRVRVLPCRIRRRGLTVRVMGHER